MFLWGTSEETYPQPRSFELFHKSRWWQWSWFMTFWSNVANKVFLESSREDIVHVGGRLLGTNMGRRWSARSGRLVRVVDLRHCKLGASNHLEKPKKLPFSHCTGLESEQNQVQIFDFNLSITDGRVNFPNKLSGFPPQTARCCVKD